MSIKHPLIIVLFFVSSIQFTVAQNCKDLTQGTFKLPYKYANVIVKIDGSSYYEYHDTNRFIKAYIKWVSDCEYTLLIQKNTLFNMPYEAGNKLHFVINKVRKNKFYYTATYNDRTWKGKMIRVKPKPF